MKNQLRWTVVLLSLFVGIGNVINGSVQSGHLKSTDGAKNMTIEIKTLVEKKKRLLIKRTNKIEKTP